MDEQAHCGRVLFKKMDTARPRIPVLYHNPACRVSYPNVLLLVAPSSDPPSTERASALKFSQLSYCTYAYGQDGFRLHILFTSEY